MSINTTLQTLKAAPFKTLYRHFVASTSKHYPSVTQLADAAVESGTTADAPDFHGIQNTTVEKAVKANEEINPLFAKYCQEAEQFYHKSDDTVKKQYERTIAEYQQFRQATMTEMHIMELNRVGIDKNMKSIIEQTAKHCGLAMPKTWSEQVKDPFEKKE